ncbi:MAG TPA: LLM class F420-dependent oxidoreductase, partial [Ilumatobacteraceae bacterium]|nr:LLM class F420-dependent oxidoreductase [Ilumatobacteraceae bacterium]
MRFGVVFPQTEVSQDPEALPAIATAVERLGYTSLLFYDHVVGAEHADREPPLWGPYTEHDPFHDPFVAMGFVAAITSQIELATGVLILPQRQTVLVAQQAADVDLLSQGRLRLGVGTGWNWVEYHALGQDFATRGRRLDEQVSLLRRLWSEPLVTFDGEFDHVERGCINPRPRRPIPVWFGGFGEPALRRA